MIVRDGGGYRLTGPGQELRRSAEAIEHAVSGFEFDVAALTKRLSGTIRVTTTGGVADRLKRTALIDTFHARNPGYQLELLISDRQLDLSVGEADLAIRAGEPRDDSLAGRKIAEVPWAVYASRSYIQRHGAPGCAADMGHHVFVVCGCPGADHPAERWLRLVAPAARVGARCETGDEQLRAVRSGIGIAPLLALHDDGDLVRVIDIAGLVTPYYLLMHKDMRHSPRIRAFADFVAAEMKAVRALLAGGQHQPDLPSTL